MPAGDWQFYDCKFNNEDTHVEARDKYYKGMSEAFARLARGSATVVHGGIDYDSPPMYGIYGSVELPTLQNWTDINEVSMIAGHASQCAELTVWLQIWMTNEDGSRSDRYTVQTSGRWERLAERNMWKTLQLLNELDLATPSLDRHSVTQLVKRDGPSCQLNLDEWRYETDHYLNTDGYILS